MDSPCTQSAADANGTLVIGTDNVDHVDVCESGTWISKFSHESKWLQYISLLQSYWHTQSELTSSKTFSDFLSGTQLTGNYLDQMSSLYYSTKVRFSRTTVTRFQGPFVVFCGLCDRDRGRRDNKRKQNIDAYKEKRVCVLRSETSARLEHEFER